MKASEWFYPGDRVVVRYDKVFYVLVENGYPSDEVLTVTGFQPVSGTGGYEVVLCEPDVSGKKKGWHPAFLQIVGGETTPGPEPGSERGRKRFWK